MENNSSHWCKTIVESVMGPSKEASAVSGNMGNSAANTSYNAALYNPQYVRIFIFL